jgi:hypothetical protein
MVAALFLRLRRKKPVADTSDGTVTGLPPAI